MGLTVDSLVRFFLFFYFRKLLNLWKKIRHEIDKNKTVNRIRRIQSEN